MDHIKFIIYINSKKKKLRGPRTRNSRFAAQEIPCYSTQDPPCFSTQFNEFNLVRQQLDREFEILQSKQIVKLNVNEKKVPEVYCVGLKVRWRRPNFWISGLKVSCLWVCFAPHLHIDRTDNTQASCKVCNCRISEIPFRINPL